MTPDELEALTHRPAPGSHRTPIIVAGRSIETLVDLPPLRDRLDDIPPLAEHFLRQHREHYRRPVEGFSREAVEALRRHAWPGNVRELDHVVERAVLMTAGMTVTAFDLALQTSRDASVSARLEEMSLEEAERRIAERGGGAITALRRL